MLKCWPLRAIVLYRLIRLVRGKHNTLAITLDLLFNSWPRDWDQRSEDTYVLTLFLCTFILSARSFFLLILKKKNISGLCKIYVGIFYKVKLFKLHAWCRWKTFFFKLQIHFSPKYSGNRCPNTFKNASISSGFHIQEEHRCIYLVTRLPVRWVADAALVQGYLLVQSLGEAVGGSGQSMDVPLHHTQGDHKAGNDDHGIHFVDPPSYVIDNYDLRTFEPCKDLNLNGAEFVFIVLSRLAGL